jgi:AcrR family transcriptional regulator
MAQELPIGFPATRRQLAKRQTRLRLLAAAKRLFARRGYDATTLRDIADLADVSTGAIFANFSDKADLFAEVIAADQAELLEEMQGMAQAASEPRETLLNMLAVGYDRHFGQLELVKARMVFSWSTEPIVERRNRAGAARIVAGLEDVLRRGVQRGALSPTLETGLVAEMIWENYMASYRRAIFDGWALDALHTLVTMQIDTLLEGYLLTGRRSRRPEAARA